MYQIMRYIFQHNPWYLLPWRLGQAFGYQCHKRIVKKPRIKKLFNGKKIILFPGNPISSAFMYSAIPDRAEIMALRALADAQTIFLDIGANIGAYSLLLLDKINTAYAFEAHPFTAQCCAENFRLNHIDPKQVLTLAVSDSVAPLSFSNQSAASPTNRVVDRVVNKAVDKSAVETATIEVPAITLDAFVKAQAFAPETSLLLKIDVEGHEYAVFAGAQQLLRDYQVKAIMFETFSPQNDLIVTMLQDYGYQLQPIGANNMLALRSA